MINEKGVEVLKEIKKTLVDRVYLSRIEKDNVIALTQAIETCQLYLDHKLVEPESEEGIVKILIDNLQFKNTQNPDDTFSAEINFSEIAQKLSGKIPRQVSVEEIGQVVLSLNIEKIRDDKLSDKGETLIKAIHDKFMGGE